MMKLALTHCCIKFGQRYGHNGETVVGPDSTKVPICLFWPALCSAKKRKTKFQSVLYKDHTLLSLLNNSFTLDPIRLILWRRCGVSVLSPVYPIYPIGADTIFTFCLPPGQLVGGNTSCSSTRYCLRGSVCRFG